MAKVREPRITPIEEDRGHGGLVQDHPMRAPMEALMDRKLYDSQMRRERSSAFWMAASIWGTSGLVIGACLGAYMMFVATNSSLPIASDALARGMAVEQARSRADEHPLTLQDPQNPQQQPANHH